MKRIFFEKTIFFISSIIVVALLFIFATYFFLISNYEEIEADQNKKHISTLISNIDKNLKYLIKKNNTIAISDDLYTYTINRNTNFIETNFPNNNATLEELEADLIIIKDLKDETIFSQYSEMIEEKKQNIFDMFTSKKLNSFESVYTIVEFNNDIFYITKHPIVKSNFTGEIKGYFYLGKIIKTSYLKEFAPFFTHIKNVSKKIITDVKTPNKVASLYFDNIYISTYIKNGYLQNNIQFYDKNNAYLFSIGTATNRTVVNEGKNTILLFSAIVLLFLLLIFFISYKYLNALRVNNDVLEVQVEKRTTQINSALKELEKVNLKLYDIAHTDFLTKVRNRRNFFIHSQNAFNKSNKKSLDLSVIIIHIDKFKSYNDEYGHDVGDKILVMFADAIKKELANTDIFGRLGGEEFAIALPNQSLEQAQTKANMLKHTIENLDIITAESTIRINANFGVSDIIGCNSIDAMIQRADSSIINGLDSKVRSRPSKL